LHPRTQATLEKLRQAKWFRCVGLRDADSAEVLSSWYEAIESCSSPEWEELCMEAANQYREKLAESSRERFSRWNEIALEIKPLAQALVQEKTQQAIEDNDLPKVFVDTVDWDILHICMEAEYADVYPPGFFASQAYWYIKGHFPCGWKGVFPDGKLIIY
jgi:hypothetical protein